MKNVFEIKNLLPKSYEDAIEELLNSNTFPWYFIDDIIEDRHKFKKYKNVSETFGITHVLFHPPQGINSQHFEFLIKILDYLKINQKINITELLRVRIRRTVFIKGHTINKYNLPHVDLMDEKAFKTFVYYVHDSDGDTVLFKQKYKKNEVLDFKNLTEIKRSSPKKGNGLYFDGLIYHSGNCPILYKKRTIINFDFKIN